MDTQNMKNIVILKNLPSNLVEEAIVVVRNKKKVADADYFKNINNKNNLVQGYMKDEDFKKIENIKKENRNYVIKEAELLVNNYLEEIENNQKIKSKFKLENKYKRLKYLNCVLFSISILSILFGFIGH